MAEVQAEVQAELLAATELTPKSGETAEHFTLRVAEKAHGKFSDAQWDQLSEEAQVWVNATIVAKAEKKPFTLLVLPEIKPTKDQAMAKKKGSKVSNAETHVYEPEEAPVEGATEGEATESVEAGAEESTTEADKPAKAAKSGNGVGPKGRKPLFSKDAKIKVMVKENPHRAGTKLFNYFKKYRDGMTVAELVASGVPYSNLRYFQGLGEVEVTE